jgi:hypothetical protein
MAVRAQRIFWSNLMNGDLSPQELIRRLVKDGYQLIESNVPSPVGKVPPGSTVLTDRNDKRAIWIDGCLYQQKEGKR